MGGFGFAGLEAFYDLIRRVVSGFNAVGLDYMFTGLWRRVFTVFHAPR